ncbi:MAG: hypothetical protein H6730_23425 [Deltaproteobacteria bacterium]|nr:hypothetical protein [Deltaproteobacteria bacterium]
MRSRVRTTLLVTALALSTSACLEQCAPGRVGAGVARLTVRNVGTLVQVINDDAACGFESPDVKYGFTVDGEPGQVGSATWRVEGCNLDFSQTPYTSEDCQGVVTEVTGKALVSATRTIRGTLTGDRDQPVVPLAPDAVEVRLDDVALDAWKVESSDSDAVMINVSGHVSAAARPRLAASASSGICMIPTPNLELAEVVYTDAQVHVAAEGRRFYVDVASSRLGAVNGRAGEQENFLGGQITVWGHDVDLPNDDDGLNPDYDPERFTEGFSCTDDLAVPVDYTCAGLGPVLAQGASRLTIRTLGAVAQLVEEDTTCGFTSDAVLRDIRITEGQIGGLGTAEFTVSGCTLRFPERSVVKTSCSGAETVVSGEVTVSAKKVMRGRLTGDLEQPVVPMDDHPADVILERIQGVDFRVGEAGTALTLVQGSLSGELHPRTAMDTELGACGFKTPIARFSAVRYLEPTDVVIEAPEGTFETTLEASDLTALNGPWDGEENLLRGTISLMGETYSLPTDARDDGLDPEYARAAFDVGWQCGTLDTEAPFECTFVEPLGQGAAQLTALLTGTLANALEADTTCGFSSDAVRFSPEITGELGEPGGTGVFTIAEPCVLALTEPTVLREDCHGKKTWAQGTVRLTGTKTLRGYVSGDPVEPIVPTTWDPAEIAIDADFTDLVMWTEPGENALTVHGGRLQATVRPRTAIDTKTGACSLPTAVAKMEAMTWTNAALRVESEGRAFEISVAGSNLTAVNGRRDAEENSLVGSIVVDGVSVAVPVKGQGLDPEYDAATFLASFTCDPDMEVPTQVEACDMSKPLGEGAARLVIAALGAVTGVVNDDTHCGYSKLGVLTDPSRVVGNPGQQGLMEWEIEDCAPEYDTPYQEDCLDRRTFVDGTARVTGHRTVTGIREEITILFISIDSIAPDAHDSVTVVHDRIELEEFETYDIDDGAQVPLRGIRFHDGVMSGTVEPMTGRNRRSDAYDIPTKVARMTNVHLEPADATILYEGKTFNVHIDRADLVAFNGAFRGEANMIEGELVLNGKLIPMPRQGLDPEYEQEDFDQRYACTRNLGETLPP